MINIKDDVLQYSIYALFHGISYHLYPSEPSLVHLLTDHDAKREHIGGLVDAAFGMSFRTAPILVAHLSTPDVAVGWNVG